MTPNEPPRPPSGPGEQQDLQHGQPWPPQGPYQQGPYQDPYPPQQPYPGQSYQQPSPYGQQPYPAPGYMPPGHQGAPRRSWPARHKILAVLGGGAGLLVVLGVIGAVAGSGHTAKLAATAASSPSWTPATQYYDTPTPAPAEAGPDMLSPGQGETVGDTSTDTTEAVITVRSAAVTTRAAQDYGSAPANGYFVVVRVSATADQAYTDGFGINELDFYALEGGSHYDPGNGNAYSALTDGQSNADVTATLAAGETSSGWIAFDVPRPHGQIVYAPNLDGQPLAEWSY